MTDEQFETMVTNLWVGHGVGCEVIEHARECRDALREQPRAHAPNCDFGEDFDGSEIRGIRPCACHVASLRRCLGRKP